MEAPEGTLDGWSAAVLIIAVPLCFYLFVKGHTAKTRTTYWAYRGALTALMLGLIALASQSGVFPTQEEMRKDLVDVPTPWELLGNLPALQQATIALVAVIWIGGGNWIVIRQCRKAGRAWWEIFNPFNPPFRDIDRRSWMQLILLAFVGFFVLQVGAALTTTAPVPPSHEASRN